MTKTDILYDRINLYYIQLPMGIMNKELNLFIKQYIEKSLEYQSETLYDPFYVNNTFIYKIQEMNLENNYVIVKLVKDIDGIQNDNSIIIVNDKNKTD